MKKFLICTHFEMFGEGNSEKKKRTEIERYWDTAVVCKIVQ